MAQVLEENFAIHNLIWTLKKVNECILEVNGGKRQTRGVSLTYECLQKRKFSPMLQQILEENLQLLKTWEMG